MKSSEVQARQPREESSSMTCLKQYIGNVTFAAVILLLVNGCALSGSGGHPSTDVELRDALIEREWGVRPLHLRLTAEGRMVDFRYRVINVEKAAPLFNSKNKAFLIDEATGAKFLVPESPKVGALRTTRPPRADRNYFIIFVNPGSYVKKGAKVTVVIGDFKAEHLIVE